MSRVMLWLPMAVGLLVVSTGSEAQPAAKTYRVALLTIGTDPANPSRVQPFFDAMRELNYVEGRNLEVTRAFGDGEFERLPALISDIVNAFSCIATAPSST